MRIQVYDNGGLTADRYSVCFWYDRDKCDLYVMSIDADMPNGVCIYCGELKTHNYKTLQREKPIQLGDLPIGPLKAIIGLLQSELDMTLEELSENKGGSDVGGAEYLERHANARLIAAAPELLAAAIEAAKQLRATGDIGHAKVLQNAILKATS